MCCQLLLFDDGRLDGIVVEGCNIPRITTPHTLIAHICTCLLYTSDAADEEDSVDLGGRRIIKKKKNREQTEFMMSNKKKNEKILNTKLLRIGEIKRKEG
eukprot:TRINITY_DN2812_c0_g1_i6.p1 TRINITY_DN2812_c0_g1~~TRINITY_DN2812_c0_g1_i6.p1  ORF type:complete len:100 (+),score=6.71 TRINITY_DN2812_c0_g1_i6:221-520(+)